MSNVTELCEFIARQGKTIEEEPNGFAVDINCAINGSPYLEGTGYFPTRQDAETFAALILPVVSAIAHERLDEDPNAGFGWNDPRDEADRPWATIVSAERDENDEPVVEESYYGDAWIVAGVALGILSEDERRALESLTEQISR